MVRIVYHSADFDGHASGAIARYFFQEVEKTDFTLHPYNYGQEFPFHKMNAGDDVFFLDVTYQPNSDMYDFESTYHWNVYICDHHKTVVESDISKYISGGILDMSRSGCELSWEYFFPDEDIPEAIHLLGRYDVWDHSDQKKWDERIYPFQLAFNTLETNPNKKEAYYNTWIKIINNDFDVEHLIKKGKIILEYQKSLNKKLVNSVGMELRFDGKNVIVANTPIKNSQFFESIYDNSKHECMLAYCRNKQGIAVSLYTDRNDIDCSLIAKSHSGGGHKQAAGFIAEKVIIENDEIFFVDFKNNN